VLLGIDQGTTGTLACLVEADGRIVARAYAAHRQICPRPGWVEHDAEEIWRSVERVVAEVLAGGGRPDGVAIANQGETVLAWDRRTGRPIHHALVWQDTRTQPLVSRLAEDPAIAARVREETGLPLDPYFSAPKLRWLLDEVPGARALAAAGHLRAGTLDAWLIERLTGGAALTDVSTAARTLLYDTRAHRWSAFLLELFDIPPGVLPELRDTDAGFGACAAPGLGGVPIVASLVDQPAALAGHGCIDTGDAKATFGTGCFVYANTGAARPRGGGTLATVAWKRAGAPACYALDGGVLAAGSAIGWLRELGVLGEGEPLDAALAGARRDPDVVCVPALVGLGAPHWDRGARAAWLGMSSAATRADLVSALVDGVACRVAEVVAAIEREAGLAITELRVDGGLTRSPALMQLQADLLGRPIAVAEQDEATVTGACAMAALRTGALTESGLRARRGRARARYEPRISSDERGARLDRFARARELAARWR
jgi:glycerol kinase